MEIPFSPAVFEAFLLAVSVVAGVFGAVLGLGGGIIIVPVLTLLFGINIRYAVGASIVSVIATSSGAAASYVREHVTNIRVAMLLEVATTLGALGGAALSPYVSQRVLFLVFAAILFYSAWLMFSKKQGAGHKALRVRSSRLADIFRLNSSYPDFQLNREIDYVVTRVPLGFALMLGAGVISGLLGIGSGALKVLAMDTAMSLPIKVSSATSNFMIGVTAAASAGTYFTRGDILPILAAPVALGVLGGSWVGTRIMARMRAERLRGLFIGVLVLIAIQMALKGLGMAVR